MNILGMGPMEVLLIVVIALIVFGPAKLPEIMGQVGKAINDFRRATSELSDEFNRTIQAELQETRAVIDETKAAVTDVHSTVNSAMTGMPAPVRTVVPGEVVSAPALAAATNGLSAEGHPETATNGTVSPQHILPPLADTRQWSWETSAPKPPVAEAPATPALTGTGDHSQSASTPGNPAATAREHAADDELLPPY